MSEPIAKRRWYAKKAARLGMVLGTSLPPFAYLRRELGGTAIRALTYHRIGRAPFDPFCVEPEVFEAQMRWLADRRLAVSLAEVESYLAGHTSLPDGAVLVTIDDGRLSTYTEARPILERHRVPAVAFVTTSLLGLTDVPPEPFVTRAMLRELVESGIDVGSHAHTHRSFGAMSLAEVEHEGRTSRAILEEATGRPVVSFAYPFGTRGDYSDETDRVLRASGFRVIFHSQHGAIHAGESASSLPRVKVEGGEGDLVFRGLCAGGMDAWRLVDHTLSRLQRVRREQPVT